MFQKIKENKFLFTELVKRDFKKKYKRTALGMLWSVISPLLSLLIMSVVFKYILKTGMEHYTTFLFCGNLIFAFFSEATNTGMGSLLDNADVFSKINVPKYLFLFSQITTALINFGLTFCVFLIFCVIDGITITPIFFMLIVPIVFLVIFVSGVGLILSACFVFFRDLRYLWGVFLTLLSYLSAIFFSIETFPEQGQIAFYFNPVFVYIQYFRTVVIDGQIPSLWMHGLIVGYAVLFLTIGLLIYKFKNQKFLYYV